jgi:hypothetical protein
VASIDLSDAVDRAFDLAEQTLAAQHQWARTLVGVATRQVDIVVGTAVVSAASTVKTVEGTVRERTHQIEGEPQDSRERTEPPPAPREAGPGLRRPGRTGGPMRSAASRTCATGRGSWTSRAAWRWARTS